MVTPVADVLRLEHEQSSPSSSPGTQPAADQLIPQPGGRRGRSVPGTAISPPYEISSPTAASYPATRKKTAWAKVRRNPAPGRARKADGSQPGPSFRRRQVRSSGCPVKTRRRPIAQRQRSDTAGGLEVMAGSSQPATDVTRRDYGLRAWGRNPAIWRRLPLPGCGLSGSADLVFGSGLEHRRLFPGRPARVVIRQRVPRPF
jgi:hypothetical protein